MPAPSGVLTPDHRRGQIPPARAGRNADRAVTALYLAHYGPLVRLAARLVRDLATAEEIVQGSFVAVHAAAASGRRLRGVRPAPAGGRPGPVSAAAPGGRRQALARARACPASREPAAGP